MTEKTSHEAQAVQPSGVLDQLSTESAQAEKTSSDAKVHEFNEQTHYVPKKTIITVRPCSHPGLKSCSAELTPEDFLGLCQR